MRPARGFIYLVMAGLVGLIAMFTVHQYTSLKIRAYARPLGKIVIAQSDIPPGTPLNGQLLATAMWPQDLIPPQAEANKDELLGRVVKSEINKGEPILKTKLAPWGTAAGLSGLVSPDKRAFTVRVDDVSGVAGFIHPGDQVDVLVEVPIPNSGEHFSKIILQNIKVLTAGQVWQQKGEPNPTVVTAVTLELTPGQGEMLNLASNQGKVRLVLRNGSSMDVAATSGVATSQLLEGAPKKAEPPPPPASPKKRARGVEMIKGLERSSATL
jgi:pilus assembly protein CpaB